MNTGTFAGYLGRDAELRSTSASDVLNFSVGVSVGFGDRKKTLWIGCALWGERAQKLAPYLVKGTAVTVTGDVDLRTYERNDGKAGSEITLNVQRVTLQGKPSGDRAPRREDSAGQNTQSKPAPEDFDDDIPF